MLCRALCAAVAVTCTLQLGHASQRLDRIKDITCVLLLSGMQKEDLDINMLNKLHRYNVNIDDINNKELQTCIKTWDNSISDKIANVSGIQQIVIKKTNNAPVHDYRGIEFPEKIRNNASYNTITSYKRRHVLNQHKYLFHGSVENKSNDDILEIKKDVKDQALQKPSSIKEQENKRNIAEKLLHSAHNDTLKTLLEDFFTNINFSTGTTTQKHIKDHDDFKNINLLKMQEKDKMPNVDFEHSFSDLSNPGNSRKTQIEKEIFVKEPVSLRKVEPDRPYQTEENLLNSLSTFKQVNKLNPHAETVSNFDSKSKDRIDTTSPMYVELKQEFSREMIKQIADSVKEIILSDLRKELHESTSVATTISTAIISTSIQTTEKTDMTIQSAIKDINTKPQQSIMNKFLDLFEEIKSLKQNTFLIANENKKENGKEMNEFSDASTSNNIIQNKPPLYNNEVNKIKRYLRANSENTYNFAPHIHRFTSNVKQEPNKSLLPLTLQTNNIEIPPLAIPLDSPQVIINQNIVVTTIIPQQIIPIRNGNGNKIGMKVNEHKSIQNFEPSRTFEAFTLKNVPRLFQETYETPISHHSQSKNKADVIRFTLNDNGNSKYNADYYERINIGQNKPHANSGEIEHQKVPRFHERLEMPEEYVDYPEQNKYTDVNDCCNEKFKYSNAMFDCCNRKIASRQQTSLYNTEHKSYDDTNFKKVLQSQQKVTDILERILGDNGYIHSVETA